METGKIIRLMVLGPTSMLMVGNMLVNGKRTSRTALGLKLGQTEIDSRAATLKVWSTAKGSSHGPTIVTIQENLARINFMAMEPASGPMEEHTLEIGKKARWKAQEYFPGQMVELIQANI
jgi:hypothetical protein